VVLALYGVGDGTKLVVFEAQAFHGTIQNVVPKLARVAAV
jgi:hypothetical protein